jgi:hypothetical protein
MVAFILMINDVMTKAEDLLVCNSVGLIVLKGDWQQIVQEYLT